MGRGEEGAGLSKPGSQMRGCTRRDSAGPHSGHSGKGGVPSVGH